MAFSVETSYLKGFIICILQRTGFFLVDLSEGRQRLRLPVCIQVPHDPSEKWSALQRKHLLSKGESYLLPKGANSALLSIPLFKREAKPLRQICRPKSISVSLQTQYSIRKSNTTNKISRANSGAQAENR